VVRASGTVDGARGLGLHDHVCWSYEDAAAFRRHARDFLIDGLALGQRVCYIGEGPAHALAAELGESEGLDRALRHGTAQVTSIWDVYRPDDVIEPEAQVAAYVSTTEQALADGFAGLRVAVDVTALVRKPAQLDAVARYEHLVDHYMAAQPFAALCGYDRSELGDQAVAEVACMHPTVNRDAAPFRLYGSTGSSAELAGELDLLCAELFPTALRRANPRPCGSQVTLDAARMSFVDHRGLMALDDHAREHGLVVVLRTKLAAPARVVEALNLTGVRVDSVA
jgi:hypothetical protein